MDIRIAPSPSSAAAAWIAGRLRNAVARRGRASLALSGGSTAPAMIEVLLESDVPWESITVFQVDERVAPDGHPARNANQLADLVCQVNLMPVTARDLRRAARRYATSLPDSFDVVHLGLGDDGHTASWPPGNHALLHSQRSVELVPEFNGWRRMTLTRRVVNAARSRVVLAVGPSKRSMVERWLLEDGRLPISAVRRTNTVVFLDHAAGPAARVDSGR